MTQPMNAHTYGIQFRNLSVSWPPFSVSSYQTCHCDHLLTDLGCGAIIRKTQPAIAINHQRGLGITNYVLHVNIYIYICVYMSVYIYIHIHIYTYIYIQIFMYTYIYNQICILQNMSVADTQILAPYQKSCVYENYRETTKKTMHEGFLKEGTPIHPRFMKVGYC